jgi:hypothetical protein
MRVRLILPLLGLLLFLPAPAAAWHQAGHYTVARIAWQQLSDKHKARITTILMSHPHYRVYLTAECPKELPEIEWAFLRASTWSDWVRYPSAPGLARADRDAIVKEFNKPVWHYVDLPYIHPNDTDRFDAPAIRKAILLPEFDDKGEPRHVLAALALSMKKLLAADTPDRDKAVALCWLFHLAGDLHQPLHGTGLIASKATFDPPFPPPDGDQGGNLLAVKVKEGDAAAVKLHFYWDALLFNNNPPYSAVEAAVTGFLKEPKFQRDQLPELTATEFLTWAEESLELAKSTVYKGKDGFLKAHSLPPKTKVAMQGLDAPALPDGYQQAAEAVAARRLVVAGYRLADQLKRAFPAAEK